MSPHRKTRSLDRILGKLEGLDETNLTILAQRLARERRLFETVFEMIRDAVLVVDPEGVIQYANQAAFSLVGLRPQELGKTSFFKRLPVVARSLGLQSFETFHDGKVASCETQVDYPEVRDVQAYLVGMEAPLGGADQGVVVVLSDVTEQKQRTEERIESEKIASVMMLAAGVAHELGNPLNSLTIHLQLLERKTRKAAGSGPEAESALKSIQVCRSEVERLDGIITNFLGAVRPRVPDLRETNLVPLLEQAVEINEELFKARSCAVEIDIPEPVPEVMVDVDQVKQVFFNIIKNALEAMSEGGRLIIRAREDGQFVSVTFSDDGEGIAKEDLSRVFQPYFSTKTEGNGLGMMVVQRIMKDHRGTVAIDSRPCLGTEVILRFQIGNPAVPLLEHSVDEDA